MILVQSPAHSPVPEVRPHVVEPTFSGQSDGHVLDEMVRATSMSWKHHSFTFQQPEADAPGFAETPLERVLTGISLSPVTGFGAAIAFLVATGAGYLCGRPDVVIFGASATAGSFLFGMMQLSLPRQ